jgi:glutamyl-tRNA synthetase
MKPVGNGKLSKRDGDKMGFPVFPLDWTTSSRRFIRLQRKGFFGSCNQLLALWVGMTEREKIILTGRISSIFDLNRVHKSELNLIRKNKWFNHQYLIKQRR